MRSCKKRIRSPQCTLLVHLAGKFGCECDQDSQLPALCSLGPNLHRRFWRKTHRNWMRKRHSKDISQNSIRRHLNRSFLRHLCSKRQKDHNRARNQGNRCKTFQLDMERIDRSHQIVKHKCFRYTNPADTGNYCCSYRGSQAQKCSSHSDTASPLGNLQNLSKSVQQCSDRCHPMWNYNKHHMYNSSIDRFRLSSMLSNPSLQVQLRTHH